MPALTGTETLLVLGQYSPNKPSGKQFQCTTRDIANLGGGGGPGRDVNSGTLDIATVNDTYIGWNSAASGAKTQIIPTSTASGQQIVIKDCTGNAQSVGAIVISPQSGTIDNSPNAQINNNSGSLLLVDTTSGWRIIAGVI